MRNTTAAGVESAPVVQAASAWGLSGLAVLAARGRMAIRMATATGITRRRPTIHPRRPIMRRGVAGIRITGGTTPAESGIFGEAEPRWGRRGSFFDTGSFCSFPCIRRRADSRGTLPMTELLIGTVSWLATFGLI